jgi:hypothetical protein
MMSKYSVCFSKKDNMILLISTYRSSLHANIVSTSGKKAKERDRDRLLVNKGEDKQQ